VFDLTLTFDNGPEPGVTPRVLDILRERGIKTTFFVIGEKLGDPERRRLRRGPMTRATGSAITLLRTRCRSGSNADAGCAQREIGRTQDAIGDLAHPQRWFRPFGGGGNLDERLLKPSVVEYLTRNKHSCVLWNAIPRDWDDPDGWADRALEQCRSQPWSLMVLHDLPSGAMNHLEYFIDRAGKLARVSIRTFRPIASRSVRAKSCDPSNPMCPLSKKVPNNEDREFQGRSDRDLRPGNKCRHHRRRQAAEGASDVEVAARKGIARRTEGLQTERPDYAFAEIELLPTVPDPDKIFCIGVNYATHLAESGHPTPPHPMIFTRFANSQVGGGQPMIRPLESERLRLRGRDGRHHRQGRPPHFARDGAGACRGLCLLQ
jgi:hypothetical protein